MTRQIREALHLLVAMFVPLYSFASSREYRRGHAPFALALRCHGQGCPAPSLADAAVRHFGIGHVYKTWHAASPCPPNSAAIVSVRRVQPQQPSTCTVCEVSRWLAGPTTLAEATPPFCASTPVPRTSVSSPFLRRMPPQRPRPFCASTPVPRTSVSSPFLGGCRQGHFELGTVQNLARGVALSPKLGERQASQAGPAPAAQHLHGMRGVEMARGPHHLGESSQEREGYRYLGGPAVSCRHGGTYTKIGSIQRRLAWPLRKDDTPNHNCLQLSPSLPR
ncbi:hypothetical protein G5714_024751 [Onychostoma macrolepis]|uniref:Secreted protein n=1 Tax=Onychostoma macrolepis TaxID=369639 RepID=A0A7J6BHG2_9TELE|nr:hypothetical protein G5714_024751 [Onychostoma macrolepis]